jgi:hypothetical protein
VLELSDGVGRYQLSELDLAVAWDVLRTRGYLSRDYAEVVMGGTTDVVWTLLLDQPYVEQVITYTSASPKRQPTLQLRVPPAPPDSTPAFALSSVGDG